MYSSMIQRRKTYKTHNIYIYIYNGSSTIHIHVLHTIYIYIEWKQHNQSAPMKHRNNFPTITAIVTFTTSTLPPKWKYLFRASGNDIFPTMNVLVYHYFFSPTSSPFFLPYEYVSLRLHSWFSYEFTVFSSLRVCFPYDFTASQTTGPWTFREHTPY